MKFLSLFILFFSFKLFAENSLNQSRKAVKKTPSRVVYYYFDYTVLKGDNFANIIKKFVKPDSIISARTPMIVKTKKSNSHIKDWASLKRGTSFRLYISTDFLNKKAVKNYFIKNRPKSWRTPIFYMASIGSFVQEFDNGTTLEFKQNSPVSLGIASTWYPKKENWSISGSAYFSNLKAAVGSIDGVRTSLSVPVEIGSNVYWDYQKRGTSFNLYGGLDFERFSTFNKAALLDGGILQLDTYITYYLTAGWAKLFKVRKFLLYAKLSVSKSLASSPDSGGSFAAASDGYNGLKYMFYLNHRVKGPWFVHILYKAHKMDGPDKLTTNRIGIGFGYNLK